MGPEENGATIPHIAALDGARGLAVAGVVLFHGGQLTGGYLGVDFFFTLSGFLITSLLLAESARTGGISLGGFWARRARRLLPALALLLLGVAVYCVAFAHRDELAQIRGDAFSTLLYVANWHEIFAHQSYFALFTSPSPLNHTWSLAIEEQFYLVWPLLFAGLLAWRKARTPRTVLVLSLLLAAASTIAMFVLYDPANTNRDYFGTDTRATAILLGAALAAALAAYGQVTTRAARRALEVAALAGVAVLVVAWAGLDGQSRTLYRGGFLICGVAATAIIAAAVHPDRGPIARVLSWKPLCALGVISYGVYLYHWPIDVLLDQQRTGFRGWPLFCAQTIVTLALSTASFRLIEQPVRRGNWTIPWRRVVPVVAAGLAALMFVVTAGAGSSSVTASAAGLDGVGGLGVPGGPRTHPLAQAIKAREIAPADARRVMVIGDSVADFLGPALQSLPTKPPLAVFNGAIQGCSFFPRVRHLRYRLSTGQLVPWTSFPCDPPWEAAAARRFRADIVIWVVSHPGVAYESAGRWYHVCDPTYRARYRDALTAEVRAVQATGARFVMTTEVYDRSYASGSDAAVDCDNPIRRSVADATGAQLVDMNAFICPNGECRTSQNGVLLRVDGTHYKGAGARIVARWIMHQISAPIPSA